MAHDQVQVGGVGVGELIDAGVPAEGGDQGDAAVFEYPLDFKGIAADIVFPEQVDPILALPAPYRRVPITCLKIPLLAIWCPADWLTPLYPSQQKPKTLMPSFCLHLPADRMDIIADKPHRAGGKNGDGLGFEIVVGLLDGLLKLLLTAEDDLLFLHVR